METKKISPRDQIQLGIYKVINPFVKGLIKIGLTPNMVTTIGLILNIGVAVIFILGAERTHRDNLSYVGWGGGMILFAGLFDMLDGQVARLGNMSSKFGAFYDSVLDRYSELIMFMGICYFLIAHHYFLSSLFTFIALIGSMMVSYIRSRAESLGIECKGGLMQRPERVITTGLFALICGISSHFIGGDYKIYVPGISFHIFETMTIFTLPLAVMAILTNITAIKRLLHSKRELDKLDQQEKKHSVKAAVLIGMITLFSLSSAFAQTTGNPSPLSFPKPKGIKNQLFYLQRDPNTNTIIYELNVGKDGVLDKETPVKVYWIRYADKGEKAGLSYIQRTFAYGIKSKALANDSYELHFVSYKKFTLYLSKSTVDKQYHVYSTVNNKKIQLDRVFLRIEGGSFWSPNIKYVDVSGFDEANASKAITERITL